ncbi:MAG: 16S rRNA (cytosine(967)-C(5))-methyltransferase RsmB [Pseudomonadota bacterium]
MTVSATVRTLAGEAIGQVIGARRSLSLVLPEVLARCEPADRGLLQELAYGTLRWRYRLDALLAQLLRQPLKAKDQDIGALLLVGLYQLAYTAVAPHAAVHATVEAVRATGKRWAVPLANAVLRGYQRRRTELDALADASDEGRWAHPGWLIERFRSDWPDAWQRILAANNERPPLVLRVNARRLDRDVYRRALDAADLPHTPLRFAPQGLALATPVGVERLPGFEDGQVSVQDGAAQLAAVLLDAGPGMRVLDACAAPGGKTAHILELQPRLAELVALDSDAQRAQRIHENLTRLRLDATVIVGDAGAPDGWWDGRPFDRILLDAPCSATGVIRRHPDIKSLRRASDIDELARSQARLVDALWPLLAPGGMLVYATCSVLRRENEAQIAACLQRRADAEERRLDMPWGVACRHGRQILPGDADAGGVGMDGFYYACLVKRSEDC